MILGALGLPAAPSTIFAQATPGTQTQPAGGNILSELSAVKYFASGLGLPTSMRASDLLVTIINALLSFAALLALLFLIIGGLMYILSAGDDKKTARAKSIIIAAIAGLLIAGTAAIIVYVIGRVLGVAAALP